MGASPVPVVPAGPAPVEAKVKASTLVAFLVGIIALCLHLWVPGYADLPAYAQSVIGAGIVSACTFAAGWLARHTPRELVPIVEVAAEAVEAIPDYTDVYFQHTKEDLRDEARARGLKVSGTKAELVERLAEDDRQEFADAGAVV